MPDASASFQQEEVQQLLRQKRIDFSAAFLPKTLHYDLESLENLHLTEDRHFWSSIKRFLVFSLLRRYAPTRFSFLDIGCGNGGLLRSIGAKFPDASLTGFDGYPEALLHCRARSEKATLVCGDINGIANNPHMKTYDVITALDVLEHLDHPEHMVEAVSKLLNPGGIFIGTVPALHSLWSPRDVFLGHRQRYERKEFALLLQSSGLRLRCSNYCFSYLVPPAYVHRKLLSRLAHVSGDAIERRELREVPIVNTLLRFIGYAEILLSFWIRIPFGTSTYCVVQKTDDATV